MNFWSALVFDAENMETATFGSENIFFPNTGNPKILKNPGADRP